MDSRDQTFWSDGLSNNKFNKALYWLRHPRAAVVVHDLLMVMVASLATGWIVHKFDQVGIAPQIPLAAELALVVALQGLVLWATGLYKGLWRFASFPDLWNIARAAFFGTLLIFTSFTVIIGSAVQSSLGAMLVYPGLLFLALGLPRMCYRFWKDSNLASTQSLPGDKRVLVLGAGRSGALLERELRHRGGFEVIGFLDDNRRLRGAQVHGIPVLGPIAGLPRFAVK